ncbi:MAG: Excinuclease ABC subunit A paralog of unknown function, partial [uncultured Rubrobacteraceae bacterium]
EHRREGRPTGAARTAQRRHPRPDPRAGRTREQPQGRQRRSPEAPADGVHRRLGLRQELPRVQHDRRGVPADDQRDLQRVRAGVHADAGAPGGRPARGADHGDHRRPGADGGRPPLDGGDGHGRQRAAADPVQPARAAAHRPARRVRLQRPVGPRERRDHRRARRQDQDREGDVQPHGRHVPALRGPGLGHGLRPDRPLRRQQVARGGGAEHPRLQHGRLVRAHLPRVWLLRHGQADPPVHQARAARPAVPRADQDQGRRHQPDVRRAHPAAAEVDAVQGRRGDAAAHPGLRRAGRGVHDLPGLRRHAPERGGAVLADRRDEHRRGVRDADQRPGRLGARAGRAVGGAAADDAGGDPRLLRRDRAGLPLARPPFRDAVGRRGAADEDDPPPRLGADRCHLRLRRADHRPAPARHPAHERPAAAPARQGQHGAGRRAQAGGHRGGRPRRRPRARSGDRGRHGLLRGSRRGAAGRRHPDRPPPGRPGEAEGDGAQPHRHAGDPRGLAPQPARRRRRPPARRAPRRHGRRRLGQELAHPRLAVRARRGGVRRPGPDPGLAAEQPGDLHRTARPDPQGVREGQRRQAGPLQRQLRGRLPDVQRRRRDLHRPGDDGRGRHHVRGVRGQALPGLGARAPPRRARHQPGARDVGGRGGGLLRRGRGAHAGRPRGPGAARRRRPGLPQPRPAADDAVRRRAPAAQAGHPHGRQGRDLRPRRADQRPAPRRRRAPARPARPARGRRPVGHRHRAPPGGHGARRLDRRPRPGRRPRRRPDRLRGHARRARRVPLDADRRAPRGLRRGHGL